MFRRFPNAKPRADSRHTRVQVFARCLSLLVLAAAPLSVGAQTQSFSPGDVIHVNTTAEGLVFSRGSNVDEDDEGVVIEGELVD